MQKLLHQVIAPARFLITLGFFLSLCIVLAHRHQKVGDYLQPWYEERNATEQYSFKNATLLEYEYYESGAIAEYVYQSIYAIII
jgi:hypothetical protein